MSTTISSVAFNGANLTLASINNKPYVAIRPICEAIGLDWSAQAQKIKRDLVLNSTVVITTTVAEDGKQREMVCLPLEYLNGWLFKIDARRVNNPQARLVVAQYQRECYSALNAYWSGKPSQKAAVAAPAAPASPALPVPARTPSYGPVFRFPFEHYTIRGVRRDGGALWFVADDLRVMFGYSTSRRRMTQGVSPENLSTVPMDGRYVLAVNINGLFQIAGKRHRVGRSPGAMRTWLVQVIRPIVQEGEAKAAAQALPPVQPGVAVLPSALPVAQGIRSSEGRETNIRALCVHMKALGKWWRQYYAPLQALNPDMVSSISDHFTDGSFAASLITDAR